VPSSANSPWLPDQPHTADVRALEASQFHVADAATILRIDPMAQRLDSANRGLLELKRQVQGGKPRSVIGKTVEKIEGLLGATGASVVGRIFKADAAPVLIATEHQV
jgi:hypothetical protein